MLNMLGLSMNGLFDILFCLPGVVLAVTLHEYTKARCSTAFGDPQPRTDGRLTLNPLKHIEPIGFILVCVFGVGWGKPVKMMLNYYAPEKRRKYNLIVRIMPVVLNLLVGLLLGVGAMLMKTLLMPETAIGVWLLYAYYVVLGAAAVNICFALGQCIPVYPMAGERVLANFMKPDTVVKMTRYQGIWQVLLVIGLLGGYMGMVIYPVCRLLLAMALPTL